MDPLDAPLDPSNVPEPDVDAEPEGFVVVLEPNDRIHFLDWGGPATADDRSAPTPGILLVHGLSATAWSWIAVARRLSRAARTVAMDLRGHGLSDSPTDGYDPESLVEDLVAVAEGSGLLAASDARVVLAGHGFGGIVAAWAAAALGERCAGLVLVDGGLIDVAATTGQDPDEFLRTLDEPPEILRSMTAFLADRRSFDPRSWDADQERAARATVVETHAGRVVPTTRPHALAASVRAMFAYRPTETLPAVSAPIAVLVATDDDDRTAEQGLRAVRAALAAAGRRPPTVHHFPGDGHNLPRYRPGEVAAAILRLRSAR